MSLKILSDLNGDFNRMKKIKGLQKTIFKVGRPKSERKKKDNRGTKVAIKFFLLFDF